MLQQQWRVIDLGEKAAVVSLTSHAGIIQIADLCMHAAIAGVVATNDKVSFYVNVVPERK
ncbi:MAG: hypothetical protein ABIU63_16060 [Chitinophagaceae bacterium]